MKIDLIDKYLREEKPTGGRQHTDSDLKAFKKRMDVDRKIRDKVFNDPNSLFNKSLKAKMENQPKWTKLEGQDILQVPNSKYAALPASGRKNATNFIVFDVKTREEITFLKKNEVYSWLTNSTVREKGL